jgi:hypothetical protein
MSETMVFRVLGGQSLRAVIECEAPLYYSLRDTAGNPLVVSRDRVREIVPLADVDPCPGAFSGAATDPGHSWDGDACSLCGAPRLAAPAASQGSTAGGEQAGACSVPKCDVEAGEPCDKHERLAAHAEGEHAFCGPECPEGGGPMSEPIIVSRFDVAMEPAIEEEQILTIGAVAEDGRPVALLLDPETRRKVGGWLVPTRAEVLSEAADYLTAKYGVTNRAAGDLRRMAEGGAR